MSISPHVIRRFSREVKLNALEQLLLIERKWCNMRYLVLIYQDEVTHSGWSEQQLAEEYQAYNALDSEFQKIAVEMQGGNALMPTQTATTVRVRDGKTLTTDGPFAETKEQLGGYYLLNCKSLDEAIAAAAKIPAANDGSIEIRPIMEFE
jgi:hypothetical protein